MEKGYFSGYLRKVSAKQNPSAWNDLPEHEKAYICKQGDLPKGVAHLRVSEMNAKILDKLYFAVMYLADCDISILDAFMESGRV